MNLDHAVLGDTFLLPEKVNGTLTLNCFNFWLVYLESEPIWRSLVRVPPDGLCI